MRPHATSWPLLVLFAVAGILAACPARAQIDPTWDHYKAYIEADNVNLPQQVQVTLTDQFLTTTWFVRQLGYFANPVRKEHGSSVFPINRPDLHYTWWHSGRAPTFTKDVIAINQFGEHTIHIVTENGFGDSEFLLNPALKNAPTGTPLPIANHYKCYPCTGDAMNVPVVLADQFLTRTATVLAPRYFCTPVEKQLADGTVYPMVNPGQHYTVYNMDFNNTVFTARVSDQFITDQQLNTILIDHLLMVPTVKELPVESRSSTWGRVKASFR
jgi:hypothetical protein